LGGFALREEKILMNYIICFDLSPTLTDQQRKEAIEHLKDEFPCHRQLLSNAWQVKTPLTDDDVLRWTRGFIQPFGNSFVMAVTNDLWPHLNFDQPLPECFR
jgi:hypothetical protein